MKQSIAANKTIGDNIAKFRLQHRDGPLTQEQLAARLQSRNCNISRGTLAKIEAGIRHISVDELEAIREVLFMEYADFFAP